MAATKERYRHFHDFLTEQALQRQWVGRQHETSWLEKATFDLGIEPFAARALVLGAAAAKGAFVQSEIERLLDDLVRASADSAGRVGKHAFQRLAGSVQQIARGALDEPGAEQLVKDAMLRNGLTPARRGLLRSRRWFRTVGLRAGHA